uniref:Uncharacterized protein n=1 Tax=Lepeophtheirus salmonis TaxID=72036 RepID=A0A0K2TCA1_LEPSM
MLFPYFISILSANQIHSSATSPTTLHVNYDLYVRYYSSCKTFFQVISRCAHLCLE